GLHLGGTLTILQDFPNFVIPGHSTRNSGRITHVKLTQGLTGALKLLGKNLDVRIAQNGRIGAEGYEIPWLKYNQNSVPTTIHLPLGITLPAS
ncbi:SubName: Full=Uncharacterized protein {ECO:0000313/EMBL:CCA67588.1}, partial [Serendipita indica DSM 11827]